MSFGNGLGKECKPISTLGCLTGGRFSKREKYPGCKKTQATFAPFSGWISRGHCDSRRGMKQLLKLYFWSYVLGTWFMLRVRVVLSARAVQTLNLQKEMRSP
jgi:hypothetical protein